ncbi:MAG: DUF1559 domain-containing protein [Armatimonadetes bacterium]|nr:DUF1559 domain-containing protein [Armatimonadota bacterium]
MRRGFTLIELLVVIAIIAILAAILFPVFARARAKARQATCQSNLKQIGLALAMYAQDYDERFPAYGFGGTYGFHWNVVIYPYIKNISLYQCPDSPRDPTRLNSTGRNWVPGVNETGCRIHSDYAFNYGGGAYGSRTWRSPSNCALAFITDIAGTFLVLDGRCDRILPSDNTLDGNYYRGDTRDACHNEGTNCLFTDGHVKWLKNNDIKRYVDGNLGPWTIDDSQNYL